MNRTLGCPRTGSACRVVLCAAAVWGALAAVQAPASAQPADASNLAAVEVRRHAGPDRYATSLEIARAFVALEGSGEGSVDAVVLVSGRDWTGAVVAPAIAGELGAPILSVPQSGLTADMLQFMRDVGVSAAVIVGANPPDGSPSVPMEADAQLRSLGVSVSRVSGTDQYATSVAAADRLSSPGRFAIVASGEVFADAQSAGPVSYRGGLPVLLTPRDSLHPEVSTWLSANSVEQVIVMGGPAALAPEVVESLEAIGVDEVLRIAGQTRYETAAAFAKLAPTVTPGCFTGPNAGLARGDVPFDAFGSAPLLAELCAPLLLTRPDRLPDATAAFLNRLRRGRLSVPLHVMGGQAAVSQTAVEDYLVVGPTNAAVTVGYNHACALRTSGEIACWGSNHHWQASPPTGTFNAVAAGSSHTCGMRVSGEIACWGSDEHGQVSPPTGTFNAVGAGDEHSCGLRTSGRVVCWGDNEHGQASPPSGTFTAVTAGGDHSCGLRASGEIACWGGWRNARRTAPSGTFAAVTSGWAHSCGLRTNGEIACWGNSHDGQASPPSGTFTAVTAGGDHSCGLRASGEAICWGNDQHERTSPPPGTFTAVASGTFQSCGIRADGDIACWGGGLNNRGSKKPSMRPRQPGAFIALSESGRYACGLRASGEIACWGNDLFGEASPPPGTFTAVAAGFNHACGLRASGEIACWGNSHYGQASPPPGTFTAVAADGWHSCGVRASGEVACWGHSYDGQASADRCGGAACQNLAHSYYGQASPPSGTFTAVAAGVVHSCGLRASGEIACWGDNRGGQASPPSGTYISIAVGDFHACGLRASGEIACWGNSHYGQASPPSGTFTAVAAGEWHSCGLRASGEIACWGRGVHDLGEATPPAAAMLAAAKFATP